MDWKYIVAIIVTVVLGVTAIVQGFKLARKKKPSWAYTTKKVIGLGSDAPPELKLMFADIPVNEVYHTDFIFFNAGREPIRASEDVVKPITIHFKDAQILKKPLIHPSNEDIQFTVEHSNDYIEIYFKCLDYQDGAIVEVLHTSSNEPEFHQGKILGAPKITSLGKFEYLPLETSEKVFAWLLLPFIAFVVLLLLKVFGVFSTLSFFSSNWGALLFFIIGALGGGGTRSIVRFLAIRKFPTRSRKPWK